MEDIKPTAFKLVDGVTVPLVVHDSQGNKKTVGSAEVSVVDGGLNAKLDIDPQHEALVRIIGSPIEASIYKKGK